MKIRAKRRPGRSGFTLVEVLLVLAILVILASLVAVAVIPAMKKSRIRAAKAQIELFSTQLEFYYTDVSSFPTTQQGMGALRLKPADLTDPLKWQGPYAGKEIPPDPWGRPYQYVSDDGQTYSLSSNGPDGQPKNDDDIVVTGSS